jgi:hypothetical protein
MAGIIRRFLVNPTYAVWPTSLVTIALNKALHQGNDTSPVLGPFGKMFTMSRMKCFLVAFGAMFVYFWVRLGSVKFAAWMDTDMIVPQLLVHGALYLQLDVVDRTKQPSLQQRSWIRQRFGIQPYPHLRLEHHHLGKLLPPIRSLVSC